MIWLNSIITKQANLLHSEIDGKVVLLAVAAGRYYEFDEIGSEIWARIDTHPVFAELCRSLTEDYAADAATVQADVYRLVAMLAENDLLTITGR